jgi:hypothetical protein
MKKILLFSFLVFTVSAMAQKKNNHTPVLQKGLYLSFSPHALLEPQQGAVGLGVGYRFNKRIELWAEGSYLYKGINTEDEFGGLHGFRAIVSGKYFYQNKKGFFVGAELRIKQYSFNNKNTFINDQLRDTLKNYQYTAQHSIMGGAVFWGKRFKLSANGKFELEGNIGVGAKYRFINRKNIANGYYRVTGPDKIDLLPEIDTEQLLPYFPTTVRLIYHL